MNIIAIIPARGGSKGIKRKNLVPIKDKPLVAYSIQHALESKLINRVIVSSDDDEIIQVSRDYGAEVPFVRPAELAEDHILDLPVFEHALQFLKDTEGYEADVVVHLRPTTPYRKSEWIDEAIELFLKHPESDAVRSVSKPEKHPYRMFTLDKEGFLDPIMKHEHPEPFLLRRQDHPDVYHYNCVIDITRPSTIFEKKSMTGNRLFPYIMNPPDVVDIDTLEDLQFVRTLYQDKL